MKKLLSLFLVSALACSGCQMFGKHKDKKKAAADQKPPEQNIPDQSGDVAFQAFIGRLRNAAAAHDMNTIATMMTPDFAYFLGANPAQDRKGDGVFQYWDEQGLWQELNGILAEKFVPNGGYMVAPPQFADASLNYDGYRAGMRLVNGSWKFVYFVRTAQADQPAPAQPGGSG